MSNLAHIPSRRHVDGNRIVAANIRAELGYAGVNQSDLATALGLSDMALSRRLSDKHNAEFSATEILNVATYFGITAGDLFVQRRGTDTKKAPTANGEGQKLPGLDSNQEPIGYQLRPVESLEERRARKATSA